MINKNMLPKTWQYENQSNGFFTGINRPTSGARFVHVLARGSNPIQLYSMDTPNGAKVSIILEELKAPGIEDAAYDAHLIDIKSGDQFSSGFVEINPGSKVPALSHHDNGTDITLFESGAILLYLAERFGHFLPTGSARYECLSWLFWQVGSAPYVGGGFGHFFAYAPEVMDYPLDRFTMETKRQLDVLEKKLSLSRYICGENYTICDMALWPWYGSIVLNEMYQAADYLDAKSYKNVMRWAKDVNSRKAVATGKRIFN